MKLANVKTTNTSEIPTYPFHNPVPPQGQKLDNQRNDFQQGWNSWEPTRTWAGRELTGRTISLFPHLSSALLAIVAETG